MKRTRQQKAKRVLLSDPIFDVSELASVGVEINNENLTTNDLNGDSSSNSRETRGHDATTKNLDSDDEDVFSENEIPTKKTKRSPLNDSAQSDAESKEEDGESSESEEDVVPVQSNSFDWKQKKEAPVKLLIQLRQEYHHSFEKPKSRKISIWKRIAKKMRQPPNNYNLTGEMCKKKWDNLYQTYKNKKLTGNKTGRGKTTFWIHFEEIDSFLGCKGSIIPGDGLTAASSTFKAGTDKDKDQSLSSSTNLNSSSLADTIPLAKSDEEDEDVKEPRLPVWVKFFSSKIEKNQEELLKKYDDMEKEKLEKIQSMEGVKIDLLKQILEKVNK